MPFHARFLLNLLQRVPDLRRYHPHHNDRFTNLGEALMWIVVLLSLMIMFIAFVWHGSHTEAIGW